MLGRLTFVLLMIVSTPTLADHDARIVSGVGNRALVMQARQLDAAAQTLHRHLHARTGRSALAHRAHALAESARHFRHHVERAASPGRLHDSHRRVGQRYGRLERDLREALWRRDGRHHGDHARAARHVLAVMHDFERAYHAAGISLRYRAEHRRDDEHRPARRRQVDDLHTGRRAQRAGRACERQSY